MARKDTEYTILNKRAKGVNSPDNQKVGSTLKAEVSVRVNRITHIGTHKKEEAWKKNTRNFIEQDGDTAGINMSSRFHF